MKIRTILFSFFLLLLISCGQELFGPTESCSLDAGFVSNPDHPKALAIQAAMDRYVGLGLPGAAVLIDDENGMWIGSAGMADIANDVQMEPCHIHKLGSVTKMMMGTLTWQYIQSGQLSLDDLMSKHIPEAAERITNGDQITLGMLLSHTAGVYDIAGDIFFNLDVLNDPEQVWTPEKLLDAMANKTANHLPGQGKKYSNSHFVLLGMILEAAIGKDHRQLMAEKIFEPLGMDNTVYYDFSAPFPKKNLAQGYIDVNNNGGDIQNVTNLNTGNFGANGVYANVGDLYLFMNALMRDKSLIEPENLEFILNNFFVEVGESPGGSFNTSYGAIHDEFRDILDSLPGDIHAYGHAGGDLSHSASLNYFPHNNTIFSATYNYGTALASGYRHLQTGLRRELLLIMAE